MDDIAESSHGTESSINTSMRLHPNANSTMTELSDNTPTVTSRLYATTWNTFFNRNRSHSAPRDVESQSPKIDQSRPHHPPTGTNDPSSSVGHRSHIPRQPPVKTVNEPTGSWVHRSQSPPSPPLNSPASHSHSVSYYSHIPRPVPPRPGTYTIPSIISRTIGTVMEGDEEDDDMFGLIKLKNKDICYTSGTIEWVGRKRSFPINSGFKILDDQLGPDNEPLWKKSKRFDKSKLYGADNSEECECADVLPTVNALVDHLNALHEAVDIVDLRLNTLEGVLSKND